MAVSPNDNAIQADAIRRIYEDAEIQLFKVIANALVKRPDVPDWAGEKMALLTGVLRKSRQVTGKLDKTVEKELEKLIELAYISGNESALEDLRGALESLQEDDAEMPREIQMALFPEGFPENQIDVDASLATFYGINQEAVAALAGATTKQLTGLHVPIVRAAEDIYRQVVTETAGTVLIGTETRLEASQRALDKFAAKGIKVFRDKRGHQWDIASYAEAATRTAVGQASLSGHIDQMGSMGFDLVMVSDHAGECDLCRPWEGQILSVSGDHPQYSSLSEATSAGLFHTNCGHRANTYFEGLTKPLEKTEDPEGYDNRQQQRYLERGLREWKKRQAVAMTPEAKQKADAKVAEWDGRLEDFTKEKGQRRKREREQNERAR